jgi:hypothetical protein
MDTGVDEVHARQKSCLPGLRKQYSCPRRPFLVNTQQEHYQLLIRETATKTIKFYAEAGVTSHYYFTVKKQNTQVVSKKA